MEIKKRESKGKSERRENERLEVWFRGFLPIEVFLSSLSLSLPPSVRMRLRVSSPNSPKSKIPWGCANRPLALLSSASERILPTAPLSLPRPGAPAAPSGLASTEVSSRRAEPRRAFFPPETGAAGATTGAALPEEEDPATAGAGSGMAVFFVFDFHFFSSKFCF